MSITMMIPIAIEEHTRSSWTEEERVRVGDRPAPLPRRLPPPHRGNPPVKRCGLQPCDRAIPALNSSRYSRPDSALRSLWRGNLLIAIILDAKGVLFGFVIYNINASVESTMVDQILSKTLIVLYINDSNKFYCTHPLYNWFAIGFCLVLFVKYDTVRNIQL